MSQLQRGVREEETGPEELRDKQSGALTHSQLGGLSAAGEKRVFAPQAPLLQPPARLFWTCPSRILGGQRVSQGSLACLPASLPPLLFFSSSSSRLSSSPAGRPRSSLAAPTPSCMGEIAKLVAIMTLHSSRRLPLKVSAPWPARPNQHAPPCCPPSPRPHAAPSPSAQKMGNKTPTHFSVPLLSRLLHKAPALRSNGELGGDVNPTRWGFCSRRGPRLPTTPFVRDSNKKPFFPHLPGPEPPFSEARPHNGAAL